MALEKLEKDLAHVSKLDDEPNDVGGMTAEELKAVFDKAPQEIQDYINEVLIPGIESMAVPGTGDFKADGSVKMRGSINMNGNRAVQLGDPVANGDAANKNYVDKVRKEAVSDREGRARGLATLDENGKLPEAQLPTYTKDETLSAATKEAYELDEGAGPDDAFQAVKAGMDAIGNIKSLVIDKIDESMTWVAPKATGQWFKVFAVGGGGGGGGGYEYDSDNGYYCGGAGGGGGHVVIQELTIPEGTQVAITCGAAGATGTSGYYAKVTAGGEGGATLFGDYLSAAGGKGGAGGSSYGAIGGDGGAGGGGGGCESGYFVEDNLNESKGGKGGTYGGGGGGKVLGGDGGLYGGGGGGETPGIGGEYGGTRVAFAYAEHLGREMVCSGKAGTNSGAGYGGNGGSETTGGGGGFGGSGGDGNGESGGGGGNYGGKGGNAGSSYSTKASTGGGGGGLFCDGGNGGSYTGGQGGGISSDGGGGCYILYFREVG